MPTRTPAVRRWLAAARLCIAPLLLAAVIWWSGPQAMLAALRDAHPGWLLAGLASSLLSNLVSAWRWQHLIRWLGYPVGSRWAVVVSFRALAVGAVLPGSTLGSDVLRIWHLHRHGCTPAQAGLSVALDRLSGLWMVWTLGTAGLAAGAAAHGTQLLQRLAGLPGDWPLLPAAVIALAAVLLLPLAVLAALRASGLGSRRLRHLLHQPGGLRAFAYQAVVSLAVQVFSVGSLACAALAFGVDLPVWLLAVTAPPIFLLASLPISFGGWGTRELAAVTAWAALGVPAPLSAGASITFGAYALLQAALGLVSVSPPEAPAAPSTSPQACGSDSAGTGQSTADCPSPREGPALASAGAGWPGIDGSCVKIALASRKAGSHRADPLAGGMADSQN